MVGASVEEGWGGMSEVAFGREVEGLKNALNITAVDANSDPHEEEPRTPSDGVVQAEEIGSLKGFEPEA